MQIILNGFSIESAYQRLTLEALVSTNHNATEAARLLGCACSTIRARCLRWGLPFGDLAAMERVLERSRAGEEIP